MLYIKLEGWVLVRINFSFFYEAEKNVRTINTGIKKIWILMEAPTFS